MKKKTTKEFIQELNEKYPKEYKVLGEYVAAKEPIKIQHKCGYEWDVSPDYLLHKNPKNPPCPLCNGAVTVKGINDLWTTNKQLAMLLWNKEDGYKYSEGTKTKVDWKCPDCGNIIKEKAIANVKHHGLTCNKCGISKSFPNRIMYNLLSQLNIEFQDEVYFDWCNFIYNNEETYGIYDFYFEVKDNKYIVEMDGGFHIKDNILSGRYLEEAQYRDKQKNILATKHNINIIRIPCIKLTASSIQNEIMKSNLKELFDLENIDWNKCFYSSCDNKIKKCCELYNNYASQYEIQENLHISYKTMSKYLEIGAKAGLCNYKKYQRFKQVVCIEDKIVFESQNEAARYYNAARSSIDNSCKYGWNVAKNKIHFMFLNEYIEKFTNRDLIYYQIS